MDSPWLLELHSWYFHQISSQIDVYCVREVYHLQHSLSLILVLFSSILVLCLWLKRKIFFVIVSHFDFSALVSLISESIAHDFSNGVFYFQNEIDVDLPIWQRQKWVVNNSQGQDTQTNIMAKRDREGFFRGCRVNNHQTSRIDC